MVVDSSIWIEILSEGRLAAKCESAIKNKTLFIPTPVVFEIYKKIKKVTSEEAALEAIGHLSQHQIVDINREIAMTAADLALEHDLAMADSLVLACAHSLKTHLLTLDNDFAGIPQTTVIR